MAQKSIQVEPARKLLGRLAMKPRSLLLAYTLASAVACGHAGEATSPPITGQRPAPDGQQRPTAGEAHAPEGESADYHAPPLAAQEPPPVFIDSIDTFMLEHFIVGTWVRDSIVDGNLEGIRAPLQALNDNGYAHVVPGKWMAGITRLQAAARLTAEAQTLAQAAKGLAAIGRACGECHRDHGGPIAKHVPPDDSSPKTDSFEARMFRHAWAVERMWEGLTMPSESAWAAGAAALAQAPASAPRAPRHVPPEIARTLDSVRALGAKATHADTFEAREQAYAELLATCADCHHKHQQ